MKSKRDTSMTVKASEKNTITKYNKKSVSKLFPTNKSISLPMKKAKLKAWVFNPFRLKYEEEILATRTHDSRRWSHVFPTGEIEFKRHAGKAVGI